MTSSEFRPYFIVIRKEEEKGDKFAKINMEVKHHAMSESMNPFIKKTVSTQTYPTKLIPAAPRKACCFYCSFRILSYFISLDLDEDPPKPKANPRSVLEPGPSIKAD
uniref:SFRICE_039183 n=1 Tax=Spodoptera frugiperda TaxID=7108 RepID=A0A2H1VIF4_SPOFR